MSTRSLVFFSLVALILPACGGSVGSAAADGADALGGKADRAANTHYYVLRTDAFDCATPGCGGQFVKRVNQQHTTCADGVSRSECSVATVDFSQTQLTDNERASFAGKPIVLGGELVDGTNGATLVVSEVWVAAAGATTAAGYASVSGTLYRVVDLGRRCFAAPCLTYRETKLNQTRGTDVAGVELAAAGASDDQVSDALTALTSGGILVDGHNETVSGPAGKAQQLVAANFYSRVSHVDAGTPSAVACGGLAGLGCGENEYCDMNLANACNAADLAGVCKPVGELCSQVYLPVCGCDGKTYSNDCERIQSRVQLAHTGACN